MLVRRKCFVTYHHADETQVSNFVSTFDHEGDVFIVRRLGEMPSDIVDSNDSGYVMRRIRENFISDSTVTLVLAGACTWARRYVDWEIQACLRQGTSELPNGLLGIPLKGFKQWPERFQINMADCDAYAGWIPYPETIDALRQGIEWAFARRTTHASKIINPRDRFGYNKACP